MKILIKDDGTIKYLESTEFNLDNLGHKTKCRASHILPASTVKCLAFMILRRVFGETGRVSAWTRSWKGPWIAILVDQHGSSSADNTFTSMSRDDCLRWERKQIEKLL